MDVSSRRQQQQRQEIVHAERDLEKHLREWVNGREERRHSKRCSLINTSICLLDEEVSDIATIEKGIKLLRQVLKSIYTEELLQFHDVLEDAICHSMASQAWAQHPTARCDISKFVYEACKALPSVKHGVLDALLSVLETSSSIYKCCPAEPFAALLNSLQLVLSKVHPNKTTMTASTSFLLRGLRTAATKGVLANVFKCLVTMPVEHLQEIRMSEVANHFCSVEVLLRHRSNRYSMKTIEGALKVDFMCVSCV